MHYVTSDIDKLSENRCDKVYHIHKFVNNICVLQKLVFSTLLFLIQLNPYVPITNI